MACLLLASSTAGTPGARTRAGDLSASAQQVAAAPGCQQLTTVDAITPNPQPGLLEVSHLGYSVDGHISIEVGGRIAASLRAAEPETLWLLSYPQRHPVGIDGRPGSELWYPLGTIRPDADGCFETTPLQLSSYDGARGITFHMALARLNPERRQEAAAWLAENSSEGWKSLPTGVELFETFDVDSGQFEAL